MGVTRSQIPSWDDTQFVTAQLAKVPQLDDTPVTTELAIGPNAKKPLILDIPLFVSDMSFGALSEEAKIALAKGAQLAGTGIASGEGGMLPEEQAANSKYFYELASARFGFSMDKLDGLQAFHFKGGQGAKTGTGGHLPGPKVKGKTAAVRGLEEGQPAVSPARFPDWDSIDDFKKFADEVREYIGGIPVGFKLSAQHVEDDIDAALEIGCDYVILDGRGGGTWAAPLIFRDNISVPTIPALTRARRYIDARNRKDATLIITGGLRTPADFAKALARSRRRSQLPADPGHRLPRNASMPHQQLPGRHRHPARRPPVPPDHRNVSPPTGPILRVIRRTNETARKSLWSHRFQPVRNRRPHKLEARNVRPLRRPLRRRSRLPFLTEHSEPNTKVACSYPLCHFVPLPESDNSC